METKGTRIGVSAEAYGKFNKKEDFVPKVITKSEEQISRIKDRIIKSILFQNLDQKEIEIVIGAMEEIQFEDQQNVITQGEQGDCLFVIEKGELDCFKLFKNEKAPRLVKQYFPGDSFGELALLYNAPRQATIVSKGPSILWKLDRETFNNIVRESAMKKRETYHDFLKKIEIFSTLEEYELYSIADALIPKSFRVGEFVINQGEIGDTFYIILDGQAEATKKFEGSDHPIHVKSYKDQDYFGELALIKGTPRAANIVALVS